MTQDFEYKAWSILEHWLILRLSPNSRDWLLSEKWLGHFKEYGSYMFLGIDLPTSKSEPDQPVDYGCGDCRRCLDACPTSYLIGMAL